MCSCQQGKASATMLRLFDLTKYHWNKYSCDCSWQGHQTVATLQQGKHWDAPHPAVMEHLSTKYGYVYKTFIKNKLKKRHQYAFSNAEFLFALLSFSINILQCYTWNAEPMLFKHDLITTWRQVFPFSQSLIFAFLSFLLLSETCYRPIILHLVFSIFVQIWHKAWQRGFHLSLTFSLCCLFPSLSLWVFSTRLISCSLWLPWKRWQTVQQPLKQQHVFLLAHQDATGMLTTGLSQHRAFSAVKRNGLYAWVYV